MNRLFSDNKQIVFFFAAALIFFVQFNLFAQKKTQTVDAPLFEITKYSNPGGGGMGLRMSSSRTYYFYKNGRIAYKSISYNPAGKKVTNTKSKYLQVSKEKISELLELAEKSDFLEAMDNYRFFQGGVDYGDSFSIKYFGKNGGKKILLTSPRKSQNDVPLPESVAKFLQKLAEIDEDLEIKYELS